MKTSRKEVNITTMRKNMIKFAAVALLSAFALTACDDEIIAKPTGYDKDSPIVNIDNTSDIYNNNLTDIYDYIRTGSLASDVLDQLLYQYSVSVFGNYNEITASKITNAKNSFGETTLKQAVKGLQHDATGNLTGASDVTKAFIDAHSAYWTKNKQGERIAEADRKLSEFARLEEKWNSIEKRIAEKMYSLVSGGSYSEENVFDEAKFLRSLGSSIENNVRSLSGANTFKGVITAKVEDYDVFNETTKNINGAEDYILHRENYQSNFGLDQVEAAEDDATYVEDSIIPDIYRQLLVEQYILDKSYDMLGRTSARKISVLSISKNSKDAQASGELMDTYVKDYIFDSSATPKEINLESFKMVSNAWTGAFMDDANYASTAEYELMDKALSSNFVNGTKPYFKATAYGDMMEEIEKIKDDPKVSENESSYTGGNTYTVEVGKEIKIRELELKNNTFTGWYIKSQGVSNLPETLKTKLFDINTANALNGDNECVKYTFDGTKWNAEGEDNKNVVNVIGEVNGKYFLRNTSRVAGTPVENDILFEEGGTQYIVLVEDAIRSKNLDKSTVDFSKPEEVEQLETYVNEIVQIVGGNDTYKNLSKKHWLEEMKLEYNDTVVYEYFKSNFPELFD